MWGSELRRRVPLVLGRAPRVVIEVGSFVGSSVIAVWAPLVREVEGGALQIQRALSFLGFADHFLFDPRTLKLEQSASLGGGGAYSLGKTVDVERLPAVPCDNDLRHRGDL